MLCSVKKKSQNLALGQMFWPNGVSPSLFIQTSRVKTKTSFISQMMIFFNISKKVTNKF